jgi:hypothetical protein
MSASFLIIFHVRRGWVAGQYAAIYLAGIHSGIFSVDHETMKRSPKIPRIVRSCGVFSVLLRIFMK